MGKTPQNSTLQSWDNLANAYQAKFMNLDLYNDTYDTFLKLLPVPKACVLEIGCGPGNITHYLLSHRPDLEIDATDLSPNMVKLAQANNPTARCQVLDARDMVQLPGKYHGLMCGFTLPYLSKEETLHLIADAAQVLLPGGAAYFSCIEGDYAQSGYERNSSGTHQMLAYYHQADYLEQALAQNHFEVLETIRKTYPKPNGPDATHLIYLARRR